MLLCFHCAHLSVGFSLLPNMLELNQLKTKPKSTSPVVMLFKESRGCSLAFLASLSGCNSENNPGGRMGKRETTIAHVTRQRAALHSNDSPWQSLRKVQAQAHSPSAVPSKCISRLGWDRPWCPWRRKGPTQAPSCPLLSSDYRWLW